MGNLQVVRLVVAGAVALVLLALLAVIALSILRGTDISSSQLIGLISFVGTLVALLAGLLGVGAVATSVQGVSQQLDEVHGKVNGHLQQHFGHTDDQVAALVDAHLRRAGLLSARPPEEST